MGLEYGMARGLAVDLQYGQRIADERYYDQQLKRAQAENIAKLDAFEADNEYMNAANSYDRNIIDADAKKTIKEIGDIVGSNPNWRTDLDARRAIKEKRTYLKSNANVIRGMASDDAFKKLNADLAEVAKNPEQHDSDAYQNLLQQKQNYIQYGHQDGQEAAKKFGAQAFVYTKPRDFRDLNKDFASIGNDFRDVIQKDIKGGGRGGYQEYANPETLGIISNQYYSQNKVQLDKEAAKVNMNPLEYTMKGIDAHVKKQRHLGDFGLQDALTLRAMDRRDKVRSGSGNGNSGQGTTWNDEMRKDYGEEKGSVFDDVLPTNITYDVVGSKGTKINVSGYEVKHTGKHMTSDVVGSNGKTYKQKFVEVYTDFPESVSKEMGFTYDPWFSGDNNIKEEFKKSASKYFSEGKDGKSREITRVKTWVPIDANSSVFRGRYDKINMPTKEQGDPTEAEDVYQSEAPYRTQNGIKYYLNPNTGQYE